MNSTNGTAPALEIGPLDRVMVLAPHPDDESLATGGILQRARSVGAETRILFVTTGENNPWAQRAVERRWRIEAADRARWGARRRAEALAAISSLGMAPESATFLGYSDQGICDLLLRDPDPLLHELVTEIATWKPTILIDPTPEDRHPDHGALAVLTDFALAQPALAAARPVRLRYLLHGSLRGAPEPPLRALRLSTSEQDRKRGAIRRHRSQLLLGSPKMLRFAQPEERFLPVAHAREVDDSHNIRLCRLDRGTLHLAIGATRRAGIGPLTVKLAVLAEGGSTTRAAIEVPQHGGVVPALNAATGEPIASALVTRKGTEARIVLPLAASGSPAIVYVKLDRPSERRLGFFDSIGWRAVPTVGASREAGVIGRAGTDEGVRTEADLASCNV